MALTPVATLTVTATWATLAAGGATVTVTGGPNSPQTYTATTDPITGIVAMTVPVSATNYTVTVTKNTGSGSSTIDCSRRRRGDAVAILPTKTVTITVQQAGAAYQNKSVVISVTGGPNGTAGAAPAYTTVAHSEEHDKHQPGDGHRPDAGSNRLHLHGQGVGGSHLCRRRQQDGHRRALGRGRDDHGDRQHERLADLPLHAMMRRTFSRLKREDGFTLSEMLVVISILGLILGAFSLIFSSAIHHSGEIQEQNLLQTEVQGRHRPDRTRGPAGVLRRHDADR